MKKHKPLGRAWWASEAFTANPDDVSLTPEAHMVERELAPTGFPLTSLTSTCVLQCGHTQPSQRAEELPVKLALVPSMRLMKSVLPETVMALGGGSLVAQFCSVTIETCISTTLLPSLLINIHSA